MGTFTTTSAFQFTPLREGRLGCCPPNPFSGDFNSRPSARGDTDEQPPKGGDHISIHAPPRGATKATKDKKTTRPFQFTPLREGRQAPTPQLGGITIFQFTPLREGRRPTSSRRKAATTFQFTPLREGRHDRRAAAERRRPHFNSRPSARGDAPERRGGTQLPDFNSRPSARGDVSKSRGATCPERFQFTPLREGRRVSLDYLVGRSDISIHAPPRGATATWRKCRSLSAIISIHAPPRGATEALGVTTDYLCDFNSRPSARGDDFCFCYSVPASLFQFTPLREGRRTVSKSALCVIRFQFTPLREGRPNQSDCTTMFP